MKIIHELIMFTRPLNLKPVSVGKPNLSPTNLDWTEPVYTRTPSSRFQAFITTFNQVVYCVFTFIFIILYNMTHVHCMYMFEEPFSFSNAFRPQSNIATNKSAA